MPEAAIGVIGGSGLYAMEGLDDVERVELTTPFGAPQRRTNSYCAALHRSSGRFFIEKAA